MEIRLKNGEMLYLDISPLILEYIGDYEGGIEQLMKDAQGERNMYATNQLIYAIIASNYDRPLTRRQAVRLVRIEDMPEIINYIIKNTPDLNNAKQAEKPKIIHEF